MLKPVWRMNTGNGIPSDLGCEVFISEFGVRQFTDLKDECYWVKKDKDINIDFYQTNQSKATKFERVECGECKGMGASFRAIRQDLTECRDCHGRGYTLELKNDL
jgi:DnaJ-class molecular chaperone